MTVLRFRWVLFGGLLAAAAHLPAAESRLSGAEEPPRISLDVNRIVLVASVIDSRGRFVAGLKAEDFEVLDNKRPQKILGLATSTGQPLRLVTLVDTSNSVRERFRFVQEVAIEFLRRAIRPPNDQAMVISFDTTVEVAAEFTGNVEELAKAIRALRPGRGTSLYDAIRYACREKFQKLERNHGWRRVIVVVSDGEDTQSSATRGMALEEAQRSDAVIYAISTNEGAAETEGDRVLRLLAQETGGMAVFPFKMHHIGPSFQRIAEELRYQYSIWYRPEPLVADGRYHSIDVRIKTKKGLTVRTRRGYYAPRS